MQRSNIGIVILIALISLLCSIILFNFKLICPTSFLEPSTLGQFGDFYGGILGTIVTILGLVFIYNTYSLQWKQLVNSKRDSDFEIINKLYSDLLQEINSIQYRRGIQKKESGEESSELFLGIDALYNFDENHPHNANSVLNHLNSIIHSFDYLIFMADKIPYKHKDMKNIMMTKIYFLYYSKITWPVFHKIYNERGKIKIEDNPDFSAFVTNYKRLTKETQEYLFNAGHIGTPTTKGMVELLSETQA